MTVNSAESFYPPLFLLHAMIHALLTDILPNMWEHFDQLISFLVVIWPRKLKPAAWDIYDIT